MEGIYPSMSYRAYLSTCQQVLHPDWEKGIFQSYSFLKAISSRGDPHAVRMHIAEGQWRDMKDSLKRASELMAEGGDWERKNRLKVYEAIFLLATRDFKRAAQLFLDSIATFTSCVTSS